MILAAALPVYLPGIDFFYKMAQADCFVVADDVAYSRSGNVNRNLICGMNALQWLTVPVLKRRQGIQPIKAMQIDVLRHWPRKHWRQILSSYQHAPYFDYYAAGLERIYHSAWERLIDVNMAIIDFLRQALDMNADYLFSSAVPTSAGAAEKIIDIAKHLRCDTYLTFPEDRQFLKEDVFGAENITLCYLSQPAAWGEKPFQGFSRELSIIDALFYYGPETRCLLKKV